MGKMATFSIGDDDDDFAQLRATKPTTATPSGKVGKVPKLGAVPLKTTQEATGGSGSSVSGGVRRAHRTYY